jgi:hypothetical protein
MSQRMRRPRGSLTVREEEADMPASTSTPRPALPMVEQVLIALVGLALVLMLSFPAARAGSALFGWVALWLPGLPAAALLACRLARVRAVAAASGPSLSARRRRPLPVMARSSRGVVRQARRVRAA